MTATKDVTLWCDGEDCFDWVTTGDSQIPRTRQKAREGKQRWGFRAGRDLCHECAEKDRIVPH